MSKNSFKYAIKKGGDNLEYNWNGLADLFANLIEKYAEDLDVDSLPDPSPDTSNNVTENKEDDSKTFAGI